MLKKIARAILLVLFAVLMMAVCPLRADAANAGETITGSFDAVAGKDVATIRYYTKADRSTYAFAGFSYNSSTGKYEYSFAAPYDGFEASQAAENVRETYGGEATIIAEYFTVARWDGAIDVSWYNEEDDEFYLDTPAKLAGLAAVVNGAYDVETRDYHIKGNQDFIESESAEGAGLPGGASGTAVKGLAKHDFSNRTIHLTADMDMGGADGSEVEHVWPTHDPKTGEIIDGKNNSPYPNWLPIGCEVAADPADIGTMVLSSFNGTLDGNGHNITNLYCYRYTYGGWAYSQGTALVGCLGVLYTDEENPEVAPAIKNLSLSGYVLGRRMVGGIVGVVGGGSSAVHGDSVGGSIVLENLANHAYVYSTDSKGVGGIAGSAYVDSGSIINCYNDGHISTVYSAPAGGIVGANEHMDIYSCYNTGPINTGTNHYGRGIGGTGNSASGFTVDSCYYLRGSGDDPTYPGYYQYNLPDSISINVTEVTSSEVTDGTMLAGLNVNGTAYVADDDGTPVLYWEKSSGTGSLSVTQPEGGTVEAEKTGEIANGSVVYLSNTPNTGWNFRYYTLNGNKMTGDYVTVNGDCNVSAYYESAKAGVLQIEPHAHCAVSVVKDGIIIEDGQAVEVTNYPVQAGDSLYEGDYLKITPSLIEGAVPDDPSMDYCAAVGEANDYLYRFTYTGDTVEIKSQPVYTVDERINADEVSLTLAVVPLTTPKLWKNTPDTSWYDGNHDTYTITTSAQLAGVDALVEEDETTFEGVTILLGNDISLTNTDGTSGIRSWDGIGNSDKAFAGTFDGQGHAVRDFHGIKSGLFAYCSGKSATNRATVKNVSVYGEATGQNASGIVSIAANTDISSCESYVAITDASLCSGGILGQDKGAANSSTTVTNCVNYGSINGSGRLGGIVGKLPATGSVSDCINKGDVKALPVSGVQAGGLVGDLYGAVTRCANYGNVTGSKGNIGGLTGQATMTTANMTDTYNVGAVTYQKADGQTTYDAAGGLIGYGSVYQMHRCFNYGATEAHSEAITTYIGSVIGRHSVNSKSVIDNVFVLDSAHTDGKLIAGKTLIQLQNDSSDFYATLYEKTASDFGSENGVLNLINSDNCFELTNETYPELKSAANTHVHTGGTATCIDLAICETCGLEYGEVDPDHHKETEIRNVKDPVWIYNGNTGDTYCAACDQLLSEGDSIPADKTREVITFTVKQEGKEDISRTYTVEQFDALKTTNRPIGYQFGFKEPVTVMAATEYVKLSDVIEDMEVSDLTLETVKVVCDGSTSNLTAETIKDCCYYFDKDGNRYSAPAAFAISQSSIAGTLEEVAAVAQPSDSLRFGYGVSEEQFTNKDEVGGKRCVSPVRYVEITMKEPEGAHIQIDDYTSGSSDTTNKTLKVDGALVSDDQTFSGEVEITAESDKVCALAVQNDDGTLTRLTCIEEGSVHTFTVNVGEDDIKLILVVKGDANLNGSVTSADVTTTKRIVAKKTTVSESKMLATDTNGNGSVTSADVTTIRRIVVGKTTGNWDK